MRNPSSLHTPSHRRCEAPIPRAYPANMSNVEKPELSEWDREVHHAGGIYTPTPETAARRAQEVRRGESAARVARLRQRIADDLEQFPSPVAPAPESPLTRE